jgi:hypothetical protein
MPKSFTRIPLAHATPGSPRFLTVVRYGAAGARPKAYLQAALHADEPPGTLVLHHLMRRLDEVDRKGGVRGEVILVPIANPIGLSQNVHGELLGRFDLGGRSNFNRGYLNLADAVAKNPPVLSGDAAENVARLRNAFRDALAAQAPRTELESLHLTLMSLGCDADIVLDLHCDAEAVLHVYLGTPLWPAARDLSADLRSRATLLADDSGGCPFDEALSSPFWRLAERFAPAPIPPACLSATVELRGRADVSDMLAEGDAERLLRFLMRRQVLDGDPGPLPEPLCEATPLTGVDMIHATSHGIVSFTKAPGDDVKAGEVVAEIVDPLAERPAHARMPLVSRTNGILFARRWDKTVRPGQVVCKVAGAVPLPGRVGPLLED